MLHPADEYDDSNDGDPYADFDFDRVADTHAIDAGEDGGGGAALPPGASWIAENITLPHRLTAVALASIGVYEVLVCVSMGVRSLRSVMVGGLMYVLLALNVVLIAAVAVLAVRTHFRLTANALTKTLKGNQRIEESAEG